MPSRDIFNYRLADVSINEIDTGSRFRKDFGDIDAFAAELAQFGMHSPITILEKSFVEGMAESNEQLDPSKPFLLLAGERRLRGAKKNKWSQIPAKITQYELSEWEIRVIELHENLRRKSMSPVEEANSKAEIHSLYQGIYGVPERGPGNEGHSIADTAKILGESVSNTQRDLELAKFSSFIPEIKEAKTKSEANKLISQFKDKLYREEIAKREEKRRQSKEGKSTESKADQRKSLLLKRYILGDFNELVKNVDARTMDLVELDPDWGISFDERLKQDAGSLAHQDYETIAPEDYIKKLTHIANEVHRVMKDNSWLLCWYSLEDWHDTTYRILSECGFTVCKMPAFWIHTSNVTGTPAFRLGQRTESFFYARKGSPRLGIMGHPNTFTHRTLAKNERNHPAEKPIELYEDLIKTFLGEERKAAACFCPFAGSGNFMIAADNLEHNAIGFDSKEKHRNDYVLKVSKGTPGQYRSYPTPSN